MRACVFHTPGRPLSVETVADPIPGELEVVVKVGRCGVCGTDLHTTQDDAGPYMSKPGTILGHEFSGEVVALGRGVTMLKPGDAVAVLPWIGCGRCRACLSGVPSQCPEARGAGMGGASGGYAEYALGGDRACVPLPTGVGWDLGALVEPMAVSLHGVRGADIKPGDKVLVIGAGPIGLAAAYWAKRAGATVAVTASSNRREDLARTCGADLFVTPEPERRLARQVAQALGAPPDVVLECVGLPGMVQTALECVRPRGLVVVLGFCTTVDSFHPAAAVAKEARINFAVLYDRREFEITVDAFEAGAPEVGRMITDVVTLDETPAAFEALRQRTHQCKVQIAP